MANLQPGYMYGIIGTFTFGLVLTRSDEGCDGGDAGAVGLLILALVTWFARIPFEPTPGVPQTGPMLIINMALVSTFVVAVEGLVFGLIPIRFLPGQKIFAWSRWRWALLWGAGLALFAHVLMYPVTLAQPSPDPATLATTLVSAGLYGAIAVGLLGRLPIPRGAQRGVRLRRGRTRGLIPPNLDDRTSWRLVAGCGGREPGRSGGPASECHIRSGALSVDDGAAPADGLVRSG